MKQETMNWVRRQVLARMINSTSLDLDGGAIEIDDRDVTPDRGRSLASWTSARPAAARGGAVLTLVLAMIAGSTTWAAPRARDDEDPAAVPDVRIEGVVRRVVLPDGPPLGRAQRKTIERRGDAYVIRLGTKADLEPLGARLREGDRVRVTVASPEGVGVLRAVDVTLRGRTVELSRLDEASTTSRNDPGEVAVDERLADGAVGGARHEGR